MTACTCPGPLTVKPEIYTKYFSWFIALQETHKRLMESGTREELDCILEGFLSALATPTAKILMKNIDDALFEKQ